MVMSDISRTLVRELERFYETANVAELPQNVEQIENLLASLLGEYVVTYLVGADPQTKRCSLPNMIMHRRILYEVKVDVRDIIRGDNIAITILNSGRVQSAKLVREKTDLDGCGTFTRLAILADPAFADRLQGISSMAKSIYETGYSWLLEFIRQHVAWLETELAKELYRILRSAFPGEKAELSGRIWFLVIERDSAGTSRGFFVFDQLRAESTFVALTRAREQTGRSPAQLFAHFLAATLDFEKMHSRYVIETKRPLDKKLRESQYLDQAPVFTITEEALYPESVYLYPVVPVGSGFLIAVFPSNLASDIVPALDNCLLDLQKAFRERREFASRTLKKLKQYRQAIADPRFIGVAAASFIKTMLEPS